MKFMLCLLIVLIMILLSLKKIETFMVLYHAIHDIPVEFIYETSVVVNTKDEYFDIFLKDLISDDYTIHIIPPKHPSHYQFLKCLSKDCEVVNRIEFPAIKNTSGTHPTCEFEVQLGDTIQSPVFSRGELTDDRYLQLIEKFNDFDHDSFKQMNYQVDDTRYHVIPIKAVVYSSIRLNTPLKMMDFDDIMAQNKMKVFFEENEEVRFNYDLYACVWNDLTKVPVCQRIAWNVGVKPEINIAKSYDMIRIVPKKKS